MRLLQLAGTAGDAAVASLAHGRDRLAGDAVAPQQQLAIQEQPAAPVRAGAALPRAAHPRRLLPHAQLPRARGNHRPELAVPRLVSIAPAHTRDAPSVSSGDWLWIGFFCRGLSSF